MALYKADLEAAPPSGSTQWQRPVVLALAAVALYGALYLLWPSSRSERFHAGVPLLWLLDFVLYQRRRMPERRRYFVVFSGGLALGALFFIWSSLTAMAHSLGGRVAPGEPLVWTYFLASLAVLYSVVHAILTRLLNVPPATRATLAAPRGWWLRGLRAFIALAIFLPYVFTTSNILASKPPMPLIRSKPTVCLMKR